MEERYFDFFYEAGGGVFLDNAMLIIMRRLLGRPTGNDSSRKEMRKEAAGVSFSSLDFLNSYCNDGGQRNPDSHSPRRLPKKKNGSLGQY